MTGPINQTELLRSCPRVHSGYDHPRDHLSVGFGSEFKSLDARRPSKHGPWESWATPRFQKPCASSGTWKSFGTRKGGFTSPASAPLNPLTLIRLAKEEGLHVTCGTSAHHLFFVDRDLANFDSTLKVLPPFRSEDDRKALCAGVLDGTIDAIISDHRPQDLEHHDVEFTLAPFGLASIESVYPVAQSALGTSQEAQSAVDQITYDRPEICAWHDHSHD